MMQQHINASRKHDLWFPAAVFFLPLVMLFIPLFIETDPAFAVYNTPGLVKILMLGLIVYAVFKGALKELRPKISPVTGSALVVLSVVGFATALFSAVNTGYAAEKTLDLAMIAGVCYFGAAFFLKAGPGMALQTLLAIFVSTVVAVPVLGILFHYRLPSDYLWPDFLPGFTYVRIYGFSLSGSIAIGIGLFALPEMNKKPIKLLVFAALVMLWAALFWTSSRGGILSIALVSALVFVAIPKVRMGVVLSFIAMVIGAYISTFIEPQSSSYGIFTAFSDTFGAVSADSLSAGRVHIWKYYLEVAAEKPIFGHGYGQVFEFTDGTFRPHAHAHNIVVEVAFAWGLIGVVAAGYLLLKGWILGLVATVQSDPDEKLPAFILISVFAVYAWVDGVYYFYQAFLPFAICVAILSASVVAKNRK